MSIAIGNVVAVKGTHIIVELYEESNKSTLFYEGKKYNGVAIQEYILIRRGFRDIVAQVQGEYLDERYQSDDKKYYIRKIDLIPKGYFEKDKFHEGIKYLPMIRDTAFLMSSEQVESIFGDKDKNFIVGKLLKEDLPISLPWAKLFNTHIGIFGNTGSGKSNTLTNLYTTLFKNKEKALEGKSRFAIIDFNGEYTKNQITKNNELKKVFELNTKSDTDEKFILSEDIFWDDEILNILFKATENTQRPFIKRIVNGRKKFKDEENSLETYTKKVIERALTSTSQKKEFVELLKEIGGFINSGSPLTGEIGNLSWHSNNFYLPKYRAYLNGGDDDATYNSYFKGPIKSILLKEPLSQFDELKLRVNLQLLSDLINGYVQFEHIQPLLKRIDASTTSLDKILTISDKTTNNNSLLSVISLRKTNQEIKKVFPLLLAKFYYEGHKNQVLEESPPRHTFHLIIDEAHNILSTQSSRESESWKDYRLELFEEIIKEGRKYGFFLTLSSQRPADISPTIMSQLHNVFIHRLENDRDLMLLANTISTLDNLSKQMIPNLSKGCSIITGTSFDIPMVVQFDEMGTEEKPDSDDVNLNDLWNN